MYSWSIGCQVQRAEGKREGFGIVVVTFVNEPNYGEAYIVGELETSIVDMKPDSPFMITFFDD